jgi:hypothetical protein
MSVRSQVTFESESFNTTETRETFINPECYGDDLVLWFMQKLRDRGVEVDDGDPSQEDFGWYATIRVDGRDYDLIVGHLGGADPPGWLVLIERSYGLIGSLLGRRSRAAVDASVIQLINEILQRSEECRNVLWFHRGDRMLGGGVPDPLTA